MDGMGTTFVKTRWGEGGFFLGLGGAPPAGRGEKESLSWRNNKRY